MTNHFDTRPDDRLGGRAEGYGIQGIRIPSPDFFNLRLTCEKGIKGDVTGIDKWVDRIPPPFEGVRFGEPLGGDWVGRETKRDSCEY